MLQTEADALSSEIMRLDQELLSQGPRIDLLKAKRDQAAASVRWVGTRVRLLDALVDDRRQQEAERVRAEAQRIRREAEGKHPLVLRLAERNAALSEALAGAATQVSTLGAQTEQTDRLARRIERQFKSARDTIAIGGLNQALGRMLQQQRRSLPDLVDYRRAMREREHRAAEIGVQRLRHWEEEERLRDLDAYLAELMAELMAQLMNETPSAPDAAPPGEALRALALDRRGLLEQSIAAADGYLRELAELEAAQRRLLAVVTDYAAFLDEYLLWVRNTSLFQLDQLDSMSAQMGRVLSPAGWRQVAQTIAYQATHTPVYAGLALVLVALLAVRGRLLALIRGLAAKLGKPTTDHFGYTLLAVRADGPRGGALAAAGRGHGLAAPGVGRGHGTSPRRSVARCLFIAGQFFGLVLLRRICMPDGLAAAHLRWPESSLRLLRSQLRQLTWIFLPAALATEIAAQLDPLDAGWALGLIPFLIAMGSLAVAFARLLHPERGVLATYARQPHRRTFKRLQPLWYPLLVLYPAVLGLLALIGYLYTAGTLSILLLDTAWFVVELILLAALGQRWLLVARRRLAYEAALERRRADRDRRRQGTTTAMARPKSRRWTW